MKPRHIRVGTSFALMLAILVSFPMKESRFSYAIVIENIKTPVDGAHKIRFSSDVLLPYQVSINENIATIQFENVEHAEIQLFDTIESELLISSEHDPESKKLKFTFMLETFPYMYVFSDASFQQHELVFQQYPYRLLFGKTIAIDPGHGAFDEKTLSIYDPGSMVEHLVESEINLEVSLLLKTMLEQRGARVYLTREREYCTENLRLLQRFEMINAIEPDIFLSIHQNESDFDYPNGIFVYYEHDEAFLLGQEIMHQTARIAELKPNHVLNDPLLTLRSIHTKKALLIECAFLSNPMDRERYGEKNFRYQLAKGITLGLVKYFENQYFYVE